MSAVPTFGLTATALSARHFGLPALAPGSDAKTYAEDTLNECLAEVSGFFRGQSVAVDELTSDGDYSEGYWLCRKLSVQLYYTAMATQTTGTDDGTARAKHHAEQARSLKKELRTFVSDVGNARSTSQTAPGTVSDLAATRRARERRQIASPNRLDRILAHNRRRY